jgi:hypothetical protein
MKNFLRKIDEISRKLWHISWKFSFSRKVKKCFCPNPSPDIIDCFNLTLFDLSMQTRKLSGYIWAFASNSFSLNVCFRETIQWNPRERPSGTYLLERKKYLFLSTVSVVSNFSNNIATAKEALLKALGKPFNLNRQYRESLDPVPLKCNIVRKWIKRSESVIKAQKKCWYS